MSENLLSRMGAHGVVLTTFLMAGCLQDFEKFRPKEDGTGGAGGDPTTTNTGGDPTTTTSSMSSMTGGMGGMGGMGGDPSSSSSGGTGGTGGSDPCGPTEKLCGNDCVAVNDPDFGCSPDDGDCTSCVFDHADATCTAGACALGPCDVNYEDCDGESDTGCEANVLLDADACGGCMSPCGSVTDAVCNDGVCEGPCGSVPPTGLHVCWVYGAFPVMPTQFVGLAGGEADPSQGETIEEKFLDPWCVSQNAGEPFVLCPLTNDPTFNIQFRAGLHLAPDQGTIAGTWDCSTDSCSGSVYVYEDGAEVGSLISDAATGVITTLPHFNPPGLKNVKVAPTP